MGLIHKPILNKILRTVIKPFSGVLPKSFRFAINGTITIRLDADKTMLFHSNPTSNVFNMLFWGGVQGFEYSEYKVFTEVVKKANLFLDIGANIGYYSCVAKKFNPTIQVHGFEPMPSANKYFKNNCVINGFNDIGVHQIALTNFTGDATFYTNINPKFPDETDFLYGDSSLNNEATGKISRIEIQVKTDTLDHFVETHLKTGALIDLIKIDTEGTENLVLEGAKNVLTNHRPIMMCEVIKGFIEREMEVILQAHNYLFFEVTPSGLKKVDRLVVEKGKLDYFFVPQEKTNQIEHLVR